MNMGEAWHWSGASNTAMNTNNSQSDDKPEIKNSEQPTPILFYVMLGFIIVSLVIFLVLSPTHLGSGSKTPSSTPSSQK
jgi:hypothetical protein